MSADLSLRPFHVSAPSATPRTVVKACAIALAVLAMTWSVTQRGEAARPAATPVVHAVAVTYSASFEGEDVGRPLLSVRELPAVDGY